MDFSPLYFVFLKGFNYLKVHCPIEGGRIKKKNILGENVSWYQKIQTNKTKQKAQNSKGKGEYLPPSSAAANASITLGI